MFKRTCLFQKTSFKSFCFLKSFYDTKIHPHCRVRISTLPSLKAGCISLAFLIVKSVADPSHPCTALQVLTLNLFPFQVGLTLIDSDLISTGKGVPLGVSAGDEDMETWIYRNADTQSVCFLKLVMIFRSVHSISH